MKMTWVLWKQIEIFEIFGGNSLLLNDPQLLLNFTRFETLKKFMYVLIR